jgi:hypothetical protein
MAVVWDNDGAGSRGSWPPSARRTAGQGIDGAHPDPPADPQGAGVGRQRGRTVYARLG